MKNKKVEAACGLLWVDYFTRLSSNSPVATHIFTNIKKKEKNLPLIDRTKLHLNRNKKENIKKNCMQMNRRFKKLCFKPRGVRRSCMTNCAGSIISPKKKRASSQLNRVFFFLCLLFGQLLKETHEIFNKWAFEQVIKKRKKLFAMLTASKSFGMIKLVLKVKTAFRQWYIHWRLVHE